MAPQLHPQFNVCGDDANQASAGGGAQAVDAHASVYDSQRWNCLHERARGDHHRARARVCAKEPDGNANASADRASESSLIEQEWRPRHLAPESVAH